MKCEGNDNRGLNKSPGEQAQKEERFSQGVGWPSQGGAEERALESAKHRKRVGSSPQLSAPGLMWNYSRMYSTRFWPLGAEGLSGRILAPCVKCHHRDLHRARHRAKDSAPGSHTQISSTDLRKDESKAVVQSGRREQFWAPARHRGGGAHGGSERDALQGVTKTPVPPFTQGNAQSLKCLPRQVHGPSVS